MSVDNQETLTDALNVATSVAMNRKEEQEQPSPEPSLQLPTRENLSKVHKADLQKRCRELGLTKIWVNKDQLIEMIINNTPSPTQNQDAVPPVANALPSLDNTMTSATIPDVTPFDITQSLDADNTQTRCPEDIPLSAATALQASYTADVEQTPTLGSTQSPSTRSTGQLSADDTQPPSTSISSHDNGDRHELTLLKINKDIETIMSKLCTKEEEIDLLNTEVKTAYTIIQHLQERISELELQIKKQDSQQEAIENVAAPLQCLLLGDTNTRRVQRSDLHDKCSVKTVARANMDLLRCWVNEQLKVTPSECEIYCGLYDILEGKSPENILDSLGYLVSDLKEINCNMKINVCQVVPVPVSMEIQRTISDYNELLFKWGEANGIGIVKTTPDFTLGTGNVDELCFEDEENKPILLNRIGVIRMLESIEKQCPGFYLSKDWKNIKKNSKTHFNRRIESGNQPTKQEARYSQRDNSVRRVAASSTYATTPSAQHLPPAPGWRPPPPSHSNSTQPQHFSTRPYYRESPPHPFTTSSHTHPTFPARKTPSHSYAEAVHRAPPRSREGNQDERWGDSRRDHDSASLRDWRQAERDNRTQSIPSTRPYSPLETQHTQNNRSYRLGCFNCGEYNHRQTTCRFDHRLRCSQCYRMGHKQRMCQNYSYSE